MAACCPAANPEASLVGEPQKTNWWAHFLTYYLPFLLILGLWLFFVGFNYLEATLPSLVSKTVFAGGKGTALGVYSTWQFMGAFAGGAAGGWVLQLAGLPGLFGLCIGLVGAWALIALPATPVVGEPGQLQDG